MNSLLKWISITHRLGKIYLDRHLEKWGINSTQHFFVLRICENEGITQDQLPSLIRLNKSNIARALAHLEKVGLIRREPYAEDKRTVRLYSTEQAKPLYKEIQTLEESWRNIILKDLPEETKQEFLYHLQTAAQAAIQYICKKTHHEGNSRDNDSPSSTLHNATKNA